LEFDPYLLAVLHDTVLEVFAMDQALNEVTKNPVPLKPYQMTRIERSFASQRLPSLAKDSTSPVFGFLDTIKDVLGQWTVSGLNLQHSMGISKDVRKVLHTRDPRY
jgi:hypothetical protein